MKHTTFSLIAIASLLFAHPLFAEEDAQAEFLKRISDAYLRSNLDAVVQMTCWDGVPAADKTNTITRYKKEVALKATKVELLGKDAADWEDWEEDDIVHTYNAPILHTLVVHVKPGSKMQLTLGEVSIKDIRLPVGRVNGKLCLLCSITKTSTKPKQIEPSSGGDSLPRADAGLEPPQK